MASTSAANAPMHHAAAGLGSANAGRSLICGILKINRLTLYQSGTYERGWGYGVVQKMFFSARLFQKTLGYRADGKDDARFSACLSGRARFNPNAPAFVLPFLREAVCPWMFCIPDVLSMANFCVERSTVYGTKGAQALLQKNNN